MCGQIYCSFRYIQGINGVRIQRIRYRGCLVISSGSAFPHPTVIPATVKVYNDLLQRLLNGNGTCSNFSAARYLFRLDRSRIGYAIGYICLLGRVAVGDGNLSFLLQLFNGIAITRKGNSAFNTAHGDLGAIRPLGIRNHHIVQSNVALILHFNGVLDRIANGHAGSGGSFLGDTHTGSSRGQSVSVSNTLISRRYRSALYGLGTIPGAILGVLIIRNNTVHIRNICQHGSRLNRLPALSFLIELLIVVDLSHSRLTGRPGTTNNGIVHSGLVLVGNHILIRIHRVDCGNGDRSGYRAAQRIGVFRQPVIHVLRVAAASDRHRQWISAYCVCISVAFVLGLLVRAQILSGLILIVDGDVIVRRRCSGVLLRGIGAVVTCLILVVAIGVKAIVQLGVRARLNGGRVGQLAIIADIISVKGLDDVHDGASACRNRAGDYASTIIPASVAVAANQLCTLIGDLEGRTLVAGDGQLVHQGDAAVGGDGYRRAIIYRFIKRVHDNAVNLSVNRRSGHPLLGEAVDGGGGLARLGAIIGGRTNAIVQIGAFARRDVSGVGQLIAYNVVPVKGSDDIDGGGCCVLGNCAGDNIPRTVLLCVTVASHQSRALVGDGEVRTRVAGNG